MTTYAIIYNTMHMQMLRETNKISIIDFLRKRDLIKFNYELGLKICVTQSYHV